MSIDKLLKKYIPMTETAFYILLSFNEPRHGYDVMQHVRQLTGDRVKLGAGTMYGTMTKMERDGMIQFSHEDEKRKIYQMTEVGRVVLQHEVERIKELYRNVEGWT